MLDQYRIFESHAHYEDEQFDEDRDALLNSFDENGIDYVVNNASSIKTTEQTIELTKKYPFVYGTVGVHPEECGEMKDEDIEWLREMSKQDKIVAIGEIGLDYYWKEPDPEIQRVWRSEERRVGKEC